ncbi:MAG: TonB-dependent receptor [Sphingobium sp.]
MQRVRIIALAMASTTVVPAYAQDAAPQAESASVVNDIVVTAQRRSQRAVEVPITITSATSEQLTTQGVQTTLDIYKVAPAVQVTHNGVWIEPAIRGVTSRVGENSVAVYIDGIYNPSKVSAATEFSNVQQVDVLKGPQGTLFGRNATGGAILITTRDPSQDFTLNASAGIEERGGRFGSAYLSDGITDNLAFDVSAYYRENDGWVKEGKAPDPGGNQALPVGTPLNAVKRFGVRSKLLWTPGDATRVTLAGEHGHLSDAGAVIYQHQSNSLVAPGVYSYKPYTAYVNQAPVNKATWDAVTLKIEHDFTDDLKLTSASSWRDEHNFISVDVDQTMQEAPNILASWDSTEKTISQEFNLAYSSGSIEAVAGLFLYRSKFAKDYISVDQISRQNITAVAPFVDVTFNLSDKFSVIGGLRYSYEKRKFFYNAPRTGPSTVAFESSVSYEDVSPRIVLRYAPTPGSSVYASYSKGFKSGLFNTDATGLAAPTDPAAQPLKPEKLDAFEIGYKMANSIVNLSLASYYYNWKNIQVSRYTNQNTIYENAASAEVYGIEAQVGLKLARGLEIQANGAWTHGRYKRFPNSSASLPETPGDPNSPLTITESQDVSGRRLIRTPDWSGNLAINYTIESDIGDFTLSPSVYYTSRFAPNSIHLDPVTGQPDRETPPRAIANATIAYTPNEKFTLTVYARNLFDKTYFSDLDVNTLGYYGLNGEPRTVGFRIDYKY